MSNENDIEELFNSRFKDAEETPSNDIWTKLESNLDKQNVEGLYQTAFQNATVEPATSVWKNISKILAWKTFFTFKFSTFNVYYASLITAIVGFMSYHFLKNDSKDAVNSSLKETEQLATNNNNAKQSQETTIQTDNISIQDNEQDFVSIKEFDTNGMVENTSKESSSAHSKELTENHSQNQEELAELGDPKNKKKQKDDVARNIDWSHVTITGEQSICKDIATTYSVEGLTVHADIQWELPKAAKKNSTIGHNISIIWQEAGSQLITAIVKVGNDRQTLTYPIKVEGVAIPDIKGKTKVCQGMEKQVYYVDENINKEVSYLWESQQNTIDQIGNKYINVDWTKSGKDTLFVTKINNVTGCKSHASVGIVVYPQPKIDYDVHPLGEQEYEFAFTETQRKGYTYEWNIEGMDYADPVVIHEAIGAGSSFVTLKVTDKNGCSSTIKKEIDFNKNFIAVPSKFVPGNGKYFLPLTNSELQSYKLEIYNARNEKVWESSELDNGHPAFGWDGTVKGSYLPKGKYMWKISAVFEDGTQWKGVTQPNGSCKPTGIFVIGN